MMRYLSKGWWASSGVLLAMVFGACGGGPSVTTGGVTPLGLGALSLNGSIHPRGVHTTYYFEYGETESYGSRTEEVPLPPRLAAYYRETWDEGTGGWGSWEQPEIHHPSGGISAGYIEWKEPAARNDFNHVMADILHLTSFLRTGLLGQWQEEGNTVLGGGDPDLRGARVSIAVRGHEWEPRGSELIWWLQSQSNQRLHDNLGWRRANWAYNGHNLTEYLLDGEWHRVQYRLQNNTNLWTYGGKNIGQGRHARRYEYWPIDQSLGHVNNNFFHLLAFVDPHDLPVGSIDFDEFELAYRNESLLFPSNGGSLTVWPSDSDQDPSTLTDGWRHGAGKMWHSGASPRGPQELVYEFENEVTVRSVQLHQNPSWPAKKIEVSTSLDGESYTPLFEATLPRKGEPNDNFAFHLAKDFQVQARHLKVILLSGYESQHWGLGEIEVFGDGATMLPDDDLYQVNQDVWSLSPGETYHYRLVARSKGGVHLGQNRSVTISADRSPQLLTGEVGRMKAGSAQLQGRICPMGLPCYYYFDYGLGPALGQRTRLAYAGTEITPRTVFARLSELEPAATYRYRLVGINGEGTRFGPIRTFTVPE